jgi:amino acid transporter
VAGVTVAFFAYVGFEDTVNVAEEVKDPSRVIPRAILAAIVITSAVYMAVVAVALATVPLSVLGESDAPLLAVLEVNNVAVPSEAFAIVALLAITNTGLLNLVMASRVAYGMANEGLLPKVLARVHARRRTPWVAVLIVFALAVVLALSGGTEILAQTTSLLLLIVFGAVHVALIVVKRRDGELARGFRAPRWLPWVGAAVCGAMATRYPLEVYLRTGAVLAVGLIAYVAVGRAGGGDPRAQRQTTDARSSAPPPDPEGRDPEG